MDLMSLKLVTDYNELEVGNGHFTSVVVLGIIALLSIIL